MADWIARYGELSPKAFGSMKGFYAVFPRIIELSLSFLLERIKRLKLVTDITLICMEMSNLRVWLEVRFEFKWRNQILTNHKPSYHLSQQHPSHLTINQRI